MLEMCDIDFCILKKRKLFIFNIPVFSYKTNSWKVGIPIKTKKELGYFLKYHPNAKTILMVEFNDCHGECLPGMAKYFLDLGFSLDILMIEKEYNNAPFANFNNSKIHLFKMTNESMVRLLCSNIVEQYEHLYINSEFLYVCKNKKISYFHILNRLGQYLKLPRKKVITLCHHIDQFSQNNFNDIFNGITLIDSPCLKREDYKVVNPHYFGNYMTTSKNKLTNFICVGSIQSERKNHSVLIDAVRYLIHKNIKNFKVTIIARIGKLDIPSELQNYFDFKGNLDYPSMYQSMNDADFYLPLLDPENPEHDRYISCAASGSYQLVYGFYKPCIICKKFANNRNKFTNDNSIIYENNSDLATAMETAIKMNNEAYQMIQNNLIATEKEIYDYSLQNLKSLLDEKEDNNSSSEVKLFYWSEKNNFGDQLNKNLMSFLKVNYHLCPPRKAELLAIGSLFYNFQTNSVRSRVPIHVFGTGFRTPPTEENEKFCRPMIFHALRGELSLRRCQKITNSSLQNVVLGDPGLLIKKIFPSIKKSKKFDVGIICHYINKNSPFLRNIQLKNLTVKFIDILNDPDIFVKEVSECSFILSSALHGLICAVSLGIPNKHIVLDDNFPGGNYKFRDFYSVFPNYYYSPIYLKNRILTEEDIFQYKKEYNISDMEVDKICSNLIKAFPFKDFS